MMATLSEKEIDALIAENKILRVKLSHINNRARHEFSAAIEIAADAFFKAAVWPHRELRDLRAGLVGAEKSES